MNEPKEILIIRLSALGDVINTLPVIPEIRRRFPGSRLNWLVEAESAAIVQAQPGIDETLVLSRRQWKSDMRHPSRWRRVSREIRDACRAIRSRAFDLAMDFQGNLRSGMWLRISGAPRRLGFHPSDLAEPTFLLATERAPRIPVPCHRVERSLHLLRSLGIHPGPPQASLPIPPSVQARAMEFLTSAGLLPGRLVAIHPGTSQFGSFKRWTDEGYIGLARRLVQEQGVSVIFTWGGQEKSAVDALVERAGLAKVRAGFATGLLDLAAIYRCADLFIGPDTGPGHLASLVGTRVVSLFGPKDPAVYRPYFSPCWVVTHDAPCRPCTARRCPRPVCMSGITVDQVHGAAKAALGMDRPAGG